MKAARILPLAVLFFIIFSFTAWLLLAVKLRGDSRVIYELQNSGHTLIFCMFTAVLIWGLQRYAQLSIRLAMFLVSIIALVFAGGSEIIQPYFGRDSSWSDIYKDGLGILAGLVLSLTWSSKGWRRITAWLATACLILFGLSEPLFWHIAKIKRDRLFPIIGDFESALASQYFHSSYQGKFSREPAPVAWQNNQSMIAKVEFNSGRWPGFQIFDLRGNWSDYETLNFEIFNPHDEDLKMVIRVHDRLHNHQHDDRFNYTFTIAPGENHYAFKIADIEQTRSGRKQQLGSMRVMMLYMPTPEQAYTLYFDNFRLE